MRNRALNGTKEKWARLLKKYESRYLFLYLFCNFFYIFNVNSQVFNIFNYIYNIYIYNN